MSQPNDDEARIVADVLHAYATDGDCDRGFAVDPMETGFAATPLACREKAIGTEIHTACGHVAIKIGEESWRLSIVSAAEMGDPPIVVSGDQLFRVDPIWFESRGPR